MGESRNSQMAQNKNSHKSWAFSLVLRRNPFEKTLRSPQKVEAIVVVFQLMPSQSKRSIGARHLRNPHVSQDKMRYNQNIGGGIGRIQENLRLATPHRQCSSTSRKIWVASKEDWFGIFCWISWWHPDTHRKPIMLQVPCRFQVQDCKY